MTLRKGNFDWGSIGTVSVLTDDGFIFTGQLILDCHGDRPSKDGKVDCCAKKDGHDHCPTQHVKIENEVEVEVEPEFIVLDLTEIPRQIIPNGLTGTAADVKTANLPFLFVVDNRVRINVAQIIAVGPDNIPD
jgi:hypothetical protein